MKKIALILFSFFIFLESKPIVSVSIPPQAYFLAQIAKDTIKINTLIPQGADPHSFEFKPQTLLALQRSDLYLTIDLEFEKIWLPKIKNNLTNTQILSISPIRTTHKDLHDSHNHDPHTWLSPTLAKIIAQNIAQILIERYPEHKNFYQTNLESLIAQIDTLHQTISNQLRNLKNRTFITYHPAWNYFARDYNLKEISIEFEGKEPTPKVLSFILQTIKTHRIQIIFVQNGFSQKLASIIAKDSRAKIWLTDPLAYEWDKELLHFTQGLLQ